MCRRLLPRSVLSLQAVQPGRDGLQQRSEDPHRQGAELLAEGLGTAAEGDLHGGVVGLILDGRGRPIAIPDDPKERVEKLRSWIAALDVNRWVLMGAINVFLLIAGFFLPPVAVILMAAPILLPIITTAGFDPI